MAYGDVTPFSAIYAIFKKLADDYILNSLYDSSEANYNKYVLPWLILSIVDFAPFCTQDLEDVDMTRGQFNFTMTLENIAMLAFIMQKYWMTNKTQNLLQMTNVVQDKDFTRHSESQNITTKEAVLNDIYERVSQRLMEYKYKVFNATWQTFVDELMS
jgi:hypothetical protein